jgi:hypothetical protein
VNKEVIEERKGMMKKLTEDTHLTVLRRNKVKQQGYHFTLIGRHKNVYNSMGWR